MSYEGPACAGCNGSGGTTETVTRDDGTKTGVWRPCGDCGGRGHS
ncbi:hypothetical protein ACFWR9_08915 [Streptomyces sp. NPDC058534]